MIAVVGSGGWGTALAFHCAQKGYPVKIWAHESEVVTEINRQHTNATFLPGITLPESIQASGSLEEVLSGCRYVITAVPSQWLRSVAKKMAPLITRNHLIISASKGLEVQSLKTLATVLEEELPMVEPGAVIALSGPNHAEEVARRIPSTTVVATPILKFAEEVQDLLISPLLRVYTNPDRLGVQLGGALKNIIALAAGISDGLGFGDNTKAALITRGLAEMARLGAAMGAQTPTFSGLSGMGDLFVTASSKHSRNAWAGRELGKGRSLAEILSSTKMVVEGVTTTQAAYRLAREKQVEIPITNITYQVLFEGVPPLEGVSRLMERVRTHEMEEVVAATYTWQ
ncbi:glycerol-3-phosphate dehydrogenase (NAD(P)+) [Hydrogenispora ethanolica]|jgi:glycerol-3-phosphate dehydrogenase (NAD(P)+)|uniref:Glycerol-3-phosphate dehydrogenase [NAD(P)+] n=1 Tax=Hydrogenispora ethanolica TaxID=1082276 RepID=A0A4R1REA8_HYDET|nr:NAD(P)H-dependent glycerol-3-phosphate dehydrogenase [Hydrogenispora ethanolica]TCL64235.1 glycerol-3-phosphate dehydrogenase (NAD(P)+) [Hydrogenispora ethanolica]